MNNDRNTETIIVLVIWCLILALWNGVHSFEIQKLKRAVTALKAK